MAVESDHGFLGAHHIRFCGASGAQLRAACARPFFSCALPTNVSTGCGGPYLLKGSWWRGERACPRLRRCRRDEYLSEFAHAKLRHPGLTPAIRAVPALCVSNGYLLPLPGSPDNHRHITSSKMPPNRLTENAAAKVMDRCCSLQVQSRSPGPCLACQGLLLSLVYTAEPCVLATWWVEDGVSGGMYVAVRKCAYVCGGSSRKLGGGGWSVCLVASE
jgi:hypothetical protein